MRTLITGVALVALAATPAVAQHAHEQDAHVHSHRGPGPHFIDAFYTENAYLERKIRPDLFLLAGETADRYTARLEVEWALLSRVAVVLHAPIHHLRPQQGPNETGIGDISVGPKVAVINDPQRLIVSVGADFRLPTGDDALGLGAGHAGAGPFALAWLPFGPERRWLVQSAAHLDVPFEAAEQLHTEISAALSWTSPLGITPLVEGITEIPLEDGDPSWWLAPGVRLEVAPAWEVGASLRLPVTGPEAGEEQVRIAIGVIRHFPLHR